MTYTIKLRRGTASDWTSVNPILAEGELGYELDTRYFKVGDGVLHWNDLEYTVDSDQYLPDPSSIEDGKTLVTAGGTWILEDFGGGSASPLTTKGDIIAYSDLESTETVLITNLDPFTYKTIAGSVSEQLVPGAMVDLDEVGSLMGVEGEVLITGSFQYSQDDPGVAKRVIVRVRRDDIFGEQLGMSADDSSLDSMVGSGESWTISITDHSPTTGKYVITVQPWSGYSASDIYTQTQLLEATTDIVHTAGPVRVPVSGVNGRVLTEDSSVDEGVSWQDTASGLPDATSIPDGKMLLTDGGEWVVGDVPAGSTDTDTRSYYATVAGVLALSTGTSRLYNDSGRTLHIVSIRATYNFNVTGTPIIVDVNQSGTTTLFTTQANRPTIAVGTLTDTSVPDITTWAAGDFLTLDVDGIGSSPPVNGLLTVQIEVTA